MTLFSDNFSQKGVRVGWVAYDWGITHFCDCFNGSTVVLYAIALAGQNTLVALGVQVGKAARELQLFAFNINAAVGEFFTLNGIVWQMVSINRQKPAHIGTFVAQETAGCFFITVMHFVVQNFAENKVQHVVEMHADISGYAARFFVKAFPP